MPSQTNTDDVRRQVSGRANANPSESYDQNTGTLGQRGEQEHCPKSDLEGSDVLDEVLIVGFEGGNRPEE